MAEDVGRLQGHVQALGRATMRSGRLDEEMETNLMNAVKALQDRIMQHLSEAEARLVADLIATRARVEDEAARARSRVQADLETALQQLSSGVALQRSLATHQNEQLSRRDQQSGRAHGEHSWRTVNGGADALIDLPPPPEYAVSESGAATRRYGGQPAELHFSGGIEDDTTSEGSDVTEDGTNTVEPAGQGAHEPEDGGDA
ncbi:hypothetical protein OC844_005494 [Tilletia horrida]|nr:hypothetical protein OC844_005494 [Tilletia horrida]